MNIAQELLDMMKQFIDGTSTVTDFSFDFPARLAFVFEDLAAVNPKLADLLDDEMPEVCAGYETDEEERKKYPDLYFSEAQIREKTLQVYQKALTLLK